MNRRHLLTGAAATAAGALLPLPPVMALAAPESYDPLVLGVRYTSKHPTIDEFYTSGSIMGHPYGTRKSLSKFLAALAKRKTFAGSEGYEFTWTIVE